MEYLVRDDPKNKELVLSAASQTAYGLLHASKALRSDRAVVLPAVRHCGDALLLSDLADDKEVVLEAVKQRGDSLRFAAKHFRGDKDVLLAAAEQDGMSLRYATDELKNDNEVVMAAVKQNGRALRHASTKLRSRLDIVSEAVKQNNTAYAYIVSEDNWTAYGVTPDNVICEQSLDEIDKETPWKPCSKGGVRAFTVDGPILYAVMEEDGFVYKQTLVRTTLETEWEGPLSGIIPMRSIAIGGGFIFGVSADVGMVHKQVLSRMSTTSDWGDAISREDTEIASIVIQGDFLYGVSTDHQIYRQKGSMMTKFTKWEGPMSNTLEVLGLSFFGMKLFAVGTDNRVHWQLAKEFSPLKEWNLMSAGDILSVCVCNKDIKDAFTDMLQTQWKAAGAHHERRAAAAMAASGAGWKNEEKPEDS